MAWPVPSSISWFYDVFSSGGSQTEKLNSGQVLEYGALISDTLTGCLQGLDCPLYKRQPAKKNLEKGFSIE